MTQIDALLADDDEPAGALLARGPGPVELMAEAAADTLDQEPHRLAPDRQEALHPQDAVPSRDRREVVREGDGVVDQGDAHDETVEIVVVVPILAVVVGGARREIVLRRRVEPQQHDGIDLPFGGRHDPDGPRHGRLDVAAQVVHRKSSCPPG